MQPRLDLGLCGCYGSRLAFLHERRAINLGCGGHPPMRVKKLILATTAVGALALSAGAAAADPTGWYGGVDVGRHWADVSTVGNGRDVDFETREDWANFIRLGYKFDQNWRVEVEGGYRKAHLGAVSVSGALGGICNVTSAAAD